MYKMRYNIYNGEVGNAKLEISFDENLETEPIVIDLSGDLENTPAPVVSPEGFVNGQNLVTQKGTEFDGEVKFNVAAAGIIKEANLTIESDSDNPVLTFLTNGTIDLCAATEEQKSALERSGVKAVGFYRNPERWRNLTLRDFARSCLKGVIR